MIAHHDHGIARIELGTLAVGRHEGAFLAPQALRAMYRHALARHQLGQGLDLALDPLGALGIDVDQAPPGMLAAELIGGRSGMKRVRTENVCNRTRAQYPAWLKLRKG